MQLLKCNKNERLKNNFGKLCLVQVSGAVNQVRLFPTEVNLKFVLSSISTKRLFFIGLWCIDCSRHTVRIFFKSFLRCFRSGF